MNNFFEIWVFKARFKYLNSIPTTKKVQLFFLLKESCVSFYIQTNGKELFFCLSTLLYTQQKKRNDSLLLRMGNVCTLSTSSIIKYQLECNSMYFSVLDQRR